MQRVGLLGTHAFLCPHLLITGNRPHSASLNPNRQVQTVNNYGRGDGRQGKNSQETIVQPWGRVMVPLQETYITISLSCFMNTETQTRWEKLTVFCPQALRCQIGWNWWCWLPITSPLTNQKNVHELIMPSLNHCRKLLTAPSSRPRHTVLRALAYCIPLCLAKQYSCFLGFFFVFFVFFLLHSKLFSLRFNLVLGYRGRIWLQE